VQDRTVIEDTESSIDLIAKGWSLYNYPSRLAYSATPADFGSLLIQRRRWANGGLIILPKLLRHMFARRSNFAEGFLRIHYLVSLASTSTAVLLLFLIPFEEGLRSFWLPLAAAPYFLLYGKDLVRAGYSWKDLFGVYALNMLLVPVHLGGVLKSLQQAFTGRKTTFGRTPKVATRTAAPPLYVWAVVSLLVWSIISAIIGFSDGHWVRFAFSFMNAIVFTFVVATFIGLRECVEDALARHPRLQTSVLRLLQDGDSDDQALAEGSLCGFRKARAFGQPAFYEAANADWEIRRPVVASPQERLNAVDVPLIPTAHGAGVTHAASVPQYGKF
jgi:hypothetical protein